MPVTRPPNRPPRPLGLSRSASQPQPMLKDRANSAPKEDPVGQRRRSSDTAVAPGNSKSLSVTHQRFSSVGSSGRWGVGVAF